ncbi:MAG: Ni/Fe hydrogenase subunit alpha [Desulfobacterium sp.]|nr:Ni/Fe hydrogenase subunit alpha [Desulfobacterium sp.]
MLGVIAKVGLDTAKKVIEIRKRCRDLMAEIGGKVIHPVLGLPGGVAKTVTRDMQMRLKEFAKEAVSFAEFTLTAFDAIVLKNKAYVDLILSDIYHDETNYMGLMDAENKVNFYDGNLRVVDTQGKQIELFSADAYTDILTEHVEDFTYIKFPYLKKFGWKGFVGGDESGIVRVAPLGRLNASTGMATRLAQKEYEKMYSTLGGQPCHNTLAWHWARLVEVLYAAERIMELSEAEALTDPNIRNMELNTPKKGIGVVEAPRGTLIHHYETDANGLIVKVNLLVATVFNSAAICMSIEKAAKKLIKNGEVNDGLLNKIEMAFRAYDPCFSCATHNLPGKMPLEVILRDRSGNIVQTIIR